MSGTQRIFSSGPFSSVMWKTPTTRDADAAARERRVADEHERVERVAVLAERALDEAVVGRVAHRGEEPAVEQIVAVSGSNSYLFREPEGTSTKTTTSAIGS